MRKLLHSLGVILMASTWSTISASADVQTVTLLDRKEPHDALVHHSGHLWIGQSRPGYSVHVYDQNQQKIGSVTLSHAVSQLSAYGKDAVIATGTSPSPNLTMFTILRIQNGSLTSNTTQVPMEAWATKWLGTLNGREYFTDPGGNTNDPETEKNPTLAAQTLFSIKRSDPRYLPTRMRLPIGGTPWNNSLLVIHKNAIGAGASNAAVVHPTTGSVQYIFPGSRNDLADLAPLGVKGYVVFAERGAGQLLVVDVAQKQVVSQIATSSPDPRGVTTFGHCALSAHYEGRSIDIISLKDPAAPVLIKTLETGLSTDDFARLNKIAVDDETGEVFARSNFPCNPMVQVCDKDWNRVVRFDDEVTQLVVNSCR